MTFIERLRNKVLELERQHQRPPHKEKCVTCRRLGLECNFQPGPFAQVPLDCRGEGVAITIRDGQMWMFNEPFDHRMLPRYVLHMICREWDKADNIEGFRVRLICVRGDKERYYYPMWVVRRDQ